MATVVQTSCSFSATGPSNNRQARWLAVTMAASMKRLLSYHIYHQAFGDSTHQAHLLQVDIVNAHISDHGYVEALEYKPVNLHPPAPRAHGLVQDRVHGYGESLAGPQPHGHMWSQSQGLVHLRSQSQGLDKVVHKRQFFLHSLGCGENLAKHRVQSGNGQQQETSIHRTLPKRLLPIPIIRRGFSTIPRPSPSRKPIFVADTIRLTDIENKIFNNIRAFLVHDNLKTQLRVAGGWVRDKLLGKESGDIDITLDNMGGRIFCRKLLAYLRNAGIATHGFGVIRSNPLQAKHLEVARMEVLGVAIDFVNLRPDDYAENSAVSLSTEDFGTVVEDAYRRDFTINSLFYNINTEMVEDPTGRGLSDLRAGIIATPLPPTLTFRDDPLRSLRALRFVAILDYELDPDTWDAIDTDIRLALASKISRERIGVEMEKIFASDQPLKALQLLVEAQLFPIVFCTPSEPESTIADGVERMCLLALEGIIDVLHYFGNSKLTVEQRKSLYWAAFLSPFRSISYKQRNKLVSLPTSIIKESLKLRSLVASRVETLHKTAINFTSIRKLLIKMQEIEQRKEEPVSDIIELEFSYAHAKHQIGTFLEQMRGLWRPALLLATIFEQEEAMVEMSHDRRKLELMRRANLCIFVEEALVRLGLDKMNGNHPFVERTMLSENG